MFLHAKTLGQWLSGQGLKSKHVRHACNQLTFVLVQVLHQHFLQGCKIHQDSGAANSTPNSCWQRYQQLISNALQCVTLFSPSKNQKRLAVLVYTTRHHQLQWQVPPRSMQADSRRERSSAHCWSQTAPGKKHLNKF